MADIQQPNDIFVATVSDPNASTMQLYQSGITGSNTQLLSLDQYKQTPFVQKQFTDAQGNFNDKAFTTAYTIAASKYKEITDKDYMKNLTSQIEYSPLDTNRPIGAKVIDITPQLEKTPNPYMQRRGLEGLYSVSDPTYTMKEIAQRNYIWDTANNKWLDSTPNSLGFFGTTFNDSLVYAQWDTDGTHTDPETGRLIKHTKGEYKTNQDGQFYTETLNGREIYNKQVVSPFDVISKDGSFMNKFDFLDSDDKNKSVIGTVAKTIVQIAPFMIPGVEDVYGALLVTHALGSALPKLYKTIDGVLNNEDKSSTPMWKALNSIEGFTQKFTPEMTEEGSQSPFSFEALANMVGETFNFIYQMKAASKLTSMATDMFTTQQTAKRMQTLSEGIGAMKVLNPEMDDALLLKQVLDLDPEIKAAHAAQSALSKSVSLGYMALTFGTGIYGEAINAGYDRRTAGIASLLSIGAQYAILDNPVGTWFLDKADGYNANFESKNVFNALKPIADRINEEVTKNIETDPTVKKTLAGLIKKAKYTVEKALIQSRSSNNLITHMGMQGVEMMSFHAIDDMTKGVIDGMNYLGLTNSDGNFNVKETVFSMDNLKQYASSFVTGAAGAALFKLNDKMVSPLIVNKKVSPDAEKELIQMIAAGHYNDIVSMVKKYRKVWGNNDLSPQFDIVNGSKVYKQSDGTFTQGDLVTDGMLKYLDVLKASMNDTGTSVKSIDDLLYKAVNDRLLIDNLKKTGLDKLYIDDYAKKVASVIQAYNGVKNGDEAEKAKAQQQYHAALEDFRNFTTGGVKADYAGLMSFVTNPKISELFGAFDVASYTKYKYGRDYWKDTGWGKSQEDLNNEFAELMEHPNSEQSYWGKFRVYQGLQKAYSEKIAQTAEEKMSPGRAKLYDNFDPDNYDKQTTTDKTANTNYRTTIVGKEKVNLDADYNLHLGDVLADQLYLGYKRAYKDESNINNDVIKQIEVLNQLSANLPSERFTEDIINKIYEVANGVLAKEGVKPIVTPDTLSRFTLNDRVLLNVLESAKGLGEYDKHIFEKIKKRLVVGLLDHVDDIKKLLVDNKFVIDDLGTLASHNESDDINNLLDSITNIEYSLNTNNVIDPNQLNSLKQLISDTKVAIHSLEHPEDDKNIEESVASSLDIHAEELEMLLNKITQIQNVNAKKDSAIVELIKQMPFFSETGGKTLFDILSSEKNNLDSVDITEYLANGGDTGQLEQALNSVKLIKALLVGMAESYNDRQGVNQVMNRLAEDGELYKVLSVDHSVSLFNELNLWEDKFNFLKSLTDLNNASRELEQNQIHEAFNETLLENYEKKFSEFNIGDAPLIDITRYNEIIHGKNIDGSDFSSSQKLYLLENHMFERFRELRKGRNVTLEEDLKGLFKEYLDDDGLFKAVNSGLTSNMKDLSKEHIMQYLVTTLTLDSKEFISKLNIVLSDPEFNKAPFISQIYAARVGYSLTKNKEIWNAFGNIIYEKSYSSQKSKLDGTSIFNCLGDSGSGKTTTVGKLIYKLTRIDDGEASQNIICGPNDVVSKNLQKSLVLENENNHKVVEKSGLFEILLKDASIIDQLSTETAEYANDYKKSLSLIEPSGEPVGITKQPNIDPVPKKGIITEDMIDIPNNIRNIFIDESTHFTKFEWSILNDIAKLKGINIFAFGDNYQNGKTLAIQTGGIQPSIVPNNIENLLTIESPRLASSIRVQNIQQRDNLLNLRTLVADLDKMNSQDISGSISSTQQEDYIKSKNIKLRYFQDENHLTGSKFTHDIKDEDILSIYNASKGINGIKVGIIVNGDPTIDTLKILKNNAGISLWDQLTTIGFVASDLKIYNVNNVQGSEAPYFIMNDIYDVTSTSFPAMKNLYTLTTRAFEGSIIKTSGDLLTKYGIKNVKDEETIPITPVSQHVIEKLKQSFKYDIEQTLKNLGVEEIPVTESVSTNPEEVSVKVPVSSSLAIEPKMFDTSDHESEKGEVLEKSQPQYTVPTTNLKEDTNYLFYVRLGHNVTNEGPLFKPGSENDDLAVFANEVNIFPRNGISVSTFDRARYENVLKNFLRLKNLLSLYHEDLSGHTMEISKLMEDLGLDKKYVDPSVIAPKLVLIKDKFDPKYDSAKMLAYDNKENEYTSQDSYLRWALKIEGKSGNNPWYITIGHTGDYRKWNGNENLQGYYDQFNKLFQVKEGERVVFGENLNDGELKLTYHEGLRVWDNGKFYNADELTDILNKDTFGLQGAKIKFDTVIFGTKQYDAIPILSGYYSQDKYSKEKKNAGWESIANTLLGTGVMTENERRALIEKKMSDPDFIALMASYQFRPYLPIYFGDSEDTRFSRNLVIMPKKRPLSELFEEFTNYEFGENTVYNRKIMQGLISKSEGFKLYDLIFNKNAGSAFTKYVLDTVNPDKWIKMFIIKNGKFTPSEQSECKYLNNVDKEISSQTKYYYDKVNETIKWLQDPETQKKLSNPDTKAETLDEFYRTRPNIGFSLLRLMNTYIKEQERENPDAHLTVDDILQTDSNDNFYYNAKICYMEKGDKDSPDQYYMLADELKHFTLNVSVEMPWVKSNLPQVIHKLIDFKENEIKPSEEVKPVIEVQKQQAQEEYVAKEDQSFKSIINVLEDYNNSNVNSAGIRQYDQIINDIINLIKSEGVYDEKTGDLVINSDGMEKIDDILYEQIDNDNVIEEIRNLIISKCS